jgi:phosphohistidine phosphatase SixA
MNVMRGAALIGFLLLVSCARSAAPAGAGEPALLLPQYYIMRHLHTAGGTDPGLTDEGLRHAQALARWLADRVSAGELAAIYVSATRRAQQTAALVAARFGITPTVYDASDTAALVASVRAETGAVLIVGHSNTVPDIVELLGGPRPADIAHDDFGDIWLLAGPERMVTRHELHID